MPVLWALLAPLRFGMAKIRAGQIAAGIEALKSGLTIWEGSGGKCHSPYFKSVLAEGMALLGDVDGALRLLDEQIVQVERPGWEERLHYAEISASQGLDAAPQV